MSLPDRRTPAAPHRPAPARPRTSGGTGTAAAAPARRAGRALAAMPRGAGNRAVARSMAATAVRTASPPPAPAGQVPAPPDELEALVLGGVEAEEHPLGPPPAPPTELEALAHRTDGAGAAGGAAGGGTGGAHGEETPQERSRRRDRFKARVKKIFQRPRERADKLATVTDAVDQPFATAGGTGAASAFIDSGRHPHDLTEAANVATGAAAVSDTPDALFGGIRNAVDLTSTVHAHRQLQDDTVTGAERHALGRARKAGAAGVGSGLGGTIGSGMNAVRHGLNAGGEAVAAGVGEAGQGAFIAAAAAGLVRDVRALVRGGLMRKKVADLRIEETDPFDETDEARDLAARISHSTDELRQATRQFRQSRTEQRTGRRDRRDGERALRARERLAHQEERDAQQRDREEGDQDRQALEARRADRARAVVEQRRGQARGEGLPRAGYRQGQKRHHTAVAEHRERDEARRERGRQRHESGRQRGAERRERAAEERATRAREQAELRELRAGVDALEAQLEQLEAAYAERRTAVNERHQLNQVHAYAQKKHKRRLKKKAVSAVANAVKISSAAVWIGVFAGAVAAGSPAGAALVGVGALLAGGLVVYKAVKSARKRKRTLMEEAEKNGTPMTPQQAWAEALKFWKTVDGGKRKQKAAELYHLAGSPDVDAEVQRDARELLKALRLDAGYLKMSEQDWAAELRPRRDGDDAAAKAKHREKWLELIAARLAS